MAPIHLRRHTIHLLPRTTSSRHPVHLRLHHHPPLLVLRLLRDLLRIVHRLASRALHLLRRDGAAALPRELRHLAAEGLARELLQLDLRLAGHRPGLLARVLELLLLPWVAVVGLLAAAAWLGLGLLARVRRADVPGHLLVLLLADVFFVGGVLVGLRTEAELLLLLLVLVQALGRHLVLSVRHLLRELVVLLPLLLCEGGLALSLCLGLADSLGSHALGGAHSDMLRGYRARANHGV